jgi:putative ABC transport system permease protein
VLGLDTLGDSYFADDPLEGGARVDVDDPVAFLNAPDSLLLSRSMAIRLGLRVGDGVQVATALGARTLTIRGLLPEKGLAAAFGGDVGVMDVFAMQIAFGREGRFDRVQVAVAKKADVERVKKRIAAALGGGIAVESPATRAARQEQMLAGLQAGTMIAGAVALLVGMFLIYNTVSIAVVDRRREIGTLRALGASRATILGLFSAEAFVLGALGGLAGVALGVFLSQGLLERASESVSALYLRISARDVPRPAAIWPAGVALGALSALFAGLFPARSAARVDPVETLRRGALGGTAPGRMRAQLAILGAVTLLASAGVARLPSFGGGPMGGYAAALLVLLGAAFLVPGALRILEAPMRFVGGALFGTAGRLAADNLARAPLRTSVTVAALMTSVAMTVNVACFVESFRASIVAWLESAVPADLFVNSTDSFIGVRNTPLQPGLGDELARLRGVEAVDRVRMVKVGYRDPTAFLVSLDKAVYAKHGRSRERRWASVRTSRVAGACTPATRSSCARRKDRGATASAPSWSITRPTRGRSSWSAPRICATSATTSSTRSTST